MTQGKKKVAILGPRGTFSEEAAARFFRDPDFLLADDIEEVFENVVAGKADYGIVPVENSLEGSVGMTMEMLLKEGAKIYGEVTLDIKQQLLAPEGVKLNEIKVVASHPHALAQCKEFIRKYNFTPANYASTAEAAREIARLKTPGTAAIASETAASMYGLRVIKRDIQDDYLNKTRFLVIHRGDHPQTGNDKTSIVIGLEDKPGALYELLGAFAERQINLTKIESRPSRKALGDYIFYIDLEGHRTDPFVEDVLSDLKRRSSFLKVLGSYPKAGPIK
ncbi:MAG: prephenate dehydratase [Candidatus Hydrothermarchaeaceae archaeon]